MRSGFRARMHGVLDRGQNAREELIKTETILK
jgi:hypothetical protein